MCSCNIIRLFVFIILLYESQPCSYIKAQVNETYDFKRNENNLKRNLFGIEGTGEVGYSFNRIDVFASYTYQYGLTDIYKAKTSSNRKSKRISNIISLGVAYKF